MVGVLWMLPLDVTSHFIFAKAFIVTQMTLVHFRVAHRVELALVPDKVVSPSKGLAAKVAGEPDAKVDILFVVLDFVFAVEAFTTVLTLVGPVVGVDRLSVSLQLFCRSISLSAGLATAWLLVSMVW